MAGADGWRGAQELAMTNAAEATEATKANEAEPANPAEPAAARRRARWLAALALALPGGCVGSTSSGSVDPREAMAAVIAADRVAGAARDAATRTQPAASVVRAYADALRAMDLAATPPEFAVAWLAHAQAWEAMAVPLSFHPAERGEMHQPFERLRDPATRGAAEFTTALDRVWATWSPIESLLERHGLE
jgi:hypothetical protein